MNLLIALVVSLSFVVTASAAVELVAHRGESHDAPENTMAAFELAWSRGIRTVELDVHLTKDGRLICIHDATTKRTGGAELKVVEQSADTLRALDVGSWKDAKFAGERMPLLDDVLAKLPIDPKRRVLIEVKVGPEAVQELARSLERANRPAEQTIIISFKGDVIREAKRQLPHLKAYWIASIKQDKETKAWSPGAAELIAKAKAAGADGLDVSAAPIVDAAFAKAAHDAGLELHVWTVDDPARAKELMAAGVDSITTNRPAWMREQLNGGEGVGERKP